MRGYIVIPRNIQQTQIWGNPQYFYWWIDLIMMANYEDTETLVGITKVSIRKGQISTSLSRLSLRWDSSRMTISRFLKYLSEEGYIQKNTTGNITIITINNYDQFQSWGSKEATADNRSVTPCIKRSVTPFDTPLIHPDVTPFEDFFEKENKIATPCHTIIYGLLEDEGMEYLNKVPLVHPFDMDDIQNVLHPCYTSDTPPTPPLLEEKNKKINNKINNPPLIPPEGGKKEEEKDGNAGVRESACVHVGAQDGTPLPNGGTGSPPPYKCASELKKEQLMELLEDSTWVEAIMIANHMKNNRGLLAAKLEEFYIHLVSSGNNLVLEGNNIQNKMKYHFSNWLRIKLKEEENEAYERQIRNEREKLFEQRLANERRKTTEYSRRRETEVSPVKESSRIRKVSHSDDW